MARGVSDEELQLKKRARRRLIGAVVLVTIVAVVLPMVLDSEPRATQPSISVQIPAQDAGVIAKAPSPLKPVEPAAVAPSPGTRPEPVTEARPAPKAEPKAEPRAEPRAEPKPEAKAGAQSKPEAAGSPAAKIEVLPAGEPRQALASASEPTTAGKVAQPATEAKATEAKATEKKYAAAPAAKSTESKPVKSEPARTRDSEKSKPAGGYAIQVAALSDAAKAKELQAKLAGAGLKAYVEVVQTAKGPVNRVRVGPYTSREAAEKARPQLRKLQLDGKVVPR